MIRQDGPIWDIWNAGGPFVGDDAMPQTRVYVERRFAGVAGDYAEDGWRLAEFNQTLSDGQTNWGRSFFFQSVMSHEFNYFTNPNGPFGDAPILREVPNIKNVQIDRSLDSPAATISIGIYNQEMADGITACDGLGTPGYYTWNQGEDPLVQARWNRDINAWHNILVPNALLRTYQGFGGVGMSLEDAVNAGYLVNTGWWLIDEIRVGTDGMLQIRGRDMAKLLIEQRCFPFTVPQDKYPLKYARWVPNPDDPAKFISGNYKDYTDVVKQLLNWAGWAIWGGIGGNMITYGNIESTGVPGGGGPSTTGGTAPGFDGTTQEMDVTPSAKTYTLDESYFDKKPIIDVIQDLKQIVGYNFWVDAYGGARFQTPNWWGPGNILIDGTRVEFIPDIDERHNLRDLTLSYSDKNARSGIMILPKLPDKGIPPTGYRQSDTADMLKGIFKLAIWSNDAFKDQWTQLVMAELINMYISRSVRVYTCTATCNPCIELDDQVWLVERQTATVSIHYVKGISTTHDLDSGDYVMNISTVWLGTLGDPNIAAEWLANNESTATGPFRLNNNTNIDEDGLITEDGDDIEDLEP